MKIGNAVAADLASVPVVPFLALREHVLRCVAEGGSIAALIATPESPEEFRLYAVMEKPRDGGLTVSSAVIGRRFASLTPDCPQAHLFEREIAEKRDITPEGHPWLKPVRFERSHAGGPAAGDMEFFSIEGAEAHAVAVGPVHAGVIEPGHFRFQCHGETVYHLEISLGYQHRGVERALVGGPDARTVHYIETLAGDTSIGHALAYSQAVEALTGISVPARSHAIRAVALELERLANHVGDLGALANDVGYLPTAAYCGRIRGDILNMTAEICGNRFGRSLVRPGGTLFDLDASKAAGLRERVQAALVDAGNAVDLLWASPSVMARFEDKGAIDRETAEEIGLVGPAARACGIERDVRNDFPSGMYRFSHVPVSTWHTGDVFARGRVRWLEAMRSFAFVRECLGALPAGDPLPHARASALRANRIVVSLVEGWRGEICHVAITDAEGRFATYKVIDPSFHNWFGLAVAMGGQEISDFPLCNKSFNLSYCGHDL